MSESGTSVANSFDLPDFIPLGAEHLKQRIYAQIRSDLERIEVEIQRQLTTSVPLIARVGHYILGSGGKRLRPLLMVLSARLCGYEGSQDAPLAVVFEFVHAATLLHDDVVDNADLRRNKPAANTIWGNPAVVLVGDYLYSKSILMAVGYNSLPILEVLSNATTTMAEGEVLQLIHADNLEIDEAEYLQVIERKTAVLMSAACQVGAIFGNGSSAQQMALRQYGLDLGMAFQLIDDTLDYTGTAKELGKPVGNDIQEGKATLPLIYALSKASAGQQARLREIFSAAQIQPEDFFEVREIVTRAGGIDYTRQLAINSVDRAKEALKAFPPHPTKQVLEEIADYVICRRV